MSEPEHWNTTQVADYLGITVGAVSAYRSRGQMPPPAITRGSRNHLWLASTIRAWKLKSWADQTEQLAYQLSGHYPEIADHLYRAVDLLRSAPTTS